MNQPKFAPHWGETASLATVAVGQEVRAIRAMTRAELLDQDWNPAYSRGEVIELGNGVSIVVSCDPEGNAPGALLWTGGPQFAPIPAGDAPIPGPVAAEAVYALVAKGDGMEPYLKAALLSVVRCWQDTGIDLTTWPALANLLLLHVPAARPLLERAEMI
jgi:hypothetical protein